MKFTAATSENPDTDRAVAEITSRASGELDGAFPDLAFLFATPHHVGDLERAVTHVTKELGARHLLGCTGESIVGGRREFEGVPAMALWAGSFPDAHLESVHVQFQQAPDGHFFTGTPKVPDEASTLILLSDPSTFPADLFLRRCGEDYPRLQILGGMSSGSRQRDENRIIVNSDVHRDGAVGVLLAGQAHVRPLVSQGCRPFGSSFVITKADRNAILTLQGRPASEILKEQIAGLAPEDSQLLAQGLHFGIAIDARKETHGRGDFLVRNVMGVNEKNGAIVVTDLVRGGQTVQFHLRDAGTASEDLHILLREAREEGRPLSGALLFTCNGRGKRLFHVHNHDADAVAKELGDIPLAGLFAAGELGPIGGQNFLHGFTASLALFQG